MNATMRASVDKLIAQTCRESYYQFFLEFWSLTAAEPLIDNWHIEELCGEIQEASERVFYGDPKEYDLLINCPPGSSKSTIFSILWQPWAWTRMPTARFITGSYAEALAFDLSRRSRDVIVSEKYKRLFPEIQLRDDQNAKGYFANNHGGWRKATGTGGKIIGFHAHFISIDDPIDPQGVLSDKVITESNIWINEGLSQRKVNRQVTLTAMIMQRLHQNDPSGYWLSQGRKIKHYCLPCDTLWEIAPLELKARYEAQDGLFDPVRFPREVLDTEEKTLGDVGFAGQFGQKPTPRGGAMFKTDKFRYDACVPKRWKREPLRYWDKAATAGGGNYTVGAKMGIDLYDRVWILDVVRDRWSSDEREREILETAKTDGKRVIIWIEQEPAGSGKESAEKAARGYARAGFRCRIDIVRASKEHRAGDATAEHRADTFSVEVNTGNVVLVPAPWNHEYVEELKHFPHSRFNDQVDASSGGYAALTKHRRRIGAV